MTLSDILLMRKDTTGNYFEFIEYFVSSVAGKNHYKYHRCDKLLSEYTSVSDEAMAILIYENNYDTWRDMVEKELTRNSSIMKKFTNGGSSKGEVASSHRYQGWSSDGIKCFNELFDLVKCDRKTENAKAFEESFQEFCITGGVISKSKKAMVPLFEQVQICHELWEDKEKDHSNSTNETNLIDNNVDNTKCDGLTDQAEENHIVLEGEEMASDEDEDPFGASKNAVSV